jgi:signal transduction histidine kinase
MHHLTDEELLAELKKRISENQRNNTELKLLNEELLSVNAKLLESEKLKSHFLSNIRNEIINPLSSILSLSKNLSTSNHLSENITREQATLIHEEAFSLDLQLANIFASAEIEAGELNPEFYIVNIAELFQSEIERFKDFAEKRKLVFEFENGLSQKPADFSFRTNPEKVKMILSNLLVNAVSCSFGPGKIIIRAEIVDEKLVFEVEDFGKGIAPENLQIIFDRFVQLNHDIYTENRGNGLGLSIIKTYLEFLNGNIDVKSEPGKGSTFTVTIPQPPEGMETDGFSGSGQEFLFEEGEIF